MASGSLKGLPSLLWRGNGALASASDGTILENGLIWKRTIYGAFCLGIDQVQSVCKVQGSLQRGCVYPCPSWDELWHVTLGHPALEGQLRLSAVPLGLFWLVVLASTIPKNGSCAGLGRGSLCVLLCSSRVMEEGQNLVALSCCEPVAKQGPPGLRLCWEHPCCHPETFPWGSK